MTIGKRLLLLLAVPLLALVGLGIFTRIELALIESRLRFVADKQVESLAVLANLSRAIAEMSDQSPSFLVLTDPVEQAAARSAYHADEAEKEALLERYADGLVSDDRDRRFLDDTRDLVRSWTAGARQVMELAMKDRRAEATALLSGPVAKLGLRLSEVSRGWIQHNEELALSASRECLATMDEARIRCSWETALRSS